MADQPQDQLSLPKSDAGLLFRLEMWATNAILGYWWVLVVAIVAVLAVVGVYGFWDGYVTSQQKELAARVETVTRKVDAALLDREKLTTFREQRGLRIVWSPSFEDQEVAWPPVVRIPLEAALREFGREGVEREPVLVEAADELVGIAKSGGTTAQAAQAALLAAELYRIAGNAESRVAALEVARTATEPTLRFSAEAALAQAALSRGDLPAAEALLRPWITEKNGWFGQKAAMDLAAAYRAADRDGDAIATLQELKQIWPTTSFVDEVEDQLEQLGAATLPAGDAPAGDGAPQPVIDVPVDLAPGEAVQFEVPGGTGSGE